MARRRAGEDNDDAAGEDNDDAAGEDNDDGGQFDEAIEWLYSSEGLAAASRHCWKRQSPIEPQEVRQELATKFWEKRTSEPEFLGRDHTISNLPAYLNVCLERQLVSIFRGAPDDVSLDGYRDKENIAEDDDRDSRVPEGFAQLLQDYRNKVSFESMSDEDAIIRLIALLRSELERADTDDSILSAALAYLVAVEHPDVDTADCPDSNGVHNDDERAMWLAGWIGNRELCFESGTISPAALRKRRHRFLKRVRLAVSRALAKIQVHLWEAENG